MMYDKDKYVRLTVAVPKELNSKIEALAKKTHMSKTALVIQLIENNIDVLSSFWETMKNPAVMQGLSDLAKLQEDTETVDSINTINQHRESNSKEIQDMDALINLLKTKK